jgi:hypothetical protein
VSVLFFGHGDGRTRSRIERWLGSDRRKESHARHDAETLTSQTKGEENAIENRLAQ